MNLLFRSLRHEKVPAVPWMPFMCIHAGRLKGYTATEIFTDAGKLFEALIEVNRRYRPDGQPILLDLQLEAEALGCELAWGENTPPAVRVHPLANRQEVPSGLPEKKDGRLPIALEVTAQMKRTLGAHTALCGVVCGPLTLALHLRGVRIFLDLYEAPDFARDLLAFTTRVSERMVEYYVEAGADVVAVADPIVSQISPTHFREFLLRPCRRVFAVVRDAGAFSTFLVWGETGRIIEQMCLAGPDSISAGESR